MSIFRGLQLHTSFRRLPGLLLVLLGVALAGCSSSDSSDPEPAPPAPPAPPPPTPPPPPALPPISATAISLDDGHQVGATRWPNGNTSMGGQGQPVGGLECAASSPVGVHIHAHLSIFLNGEALAVPNEIGHVDLSPTTNCHYQLHSHDATGLVHVHSATPTTFTLGQYFAIWGQTLSSTDIAGLTGMPVVVYVTDNGIVTQNTGDWSAIELNTHREITIQVGTAITEIPNFVWTGP